SSPSSGNSVRWIVSSKRRLTFSWIAKRSCSEFQRKTVMRSVPSVYRSRAVIPTTNSGPAQTQPSVLLRVHVLRVDDLVFLAGAPGTALGSGVGSGPARGSARGGPAIHRLGHPVGGLLQPLHGGVQVRRSAGLERLAGIGERGLELSDLRRIQL